MASHLKGDPVKAIAPQPKTGGWHWVEWACEFGGTFFQLFLGFGAVALLESPLAPGRHTISSGGLRLVLIGVAFGLLAAAVALSPIGRRSGAHLNPAVTAGFWARGHTHRDDLIGYVAGQTLGAIAAAGCFVLVFGDWARTAGAARTEPAQGLPLWGAAIIEAALTCGLLLVVFAMVSHPRLARLTPAAVTGWLPFLIWAGAPHTGASMNPSRTLGPDLVTATFPALWVYLIAPVVGALAAAELFNLVPRRTTLTAKLYHDSSYPTTQRSHLPAKPPADKTLPPRRPPCNAKLPTVAGSSRGESTGVAPTPDPGEDRRVPRVGRSNSSP